MIGLHTIRHWFDDLPDGLKNLFDLASIAALLGSLTALLPALASGLTIIWTAIRIYETRTVQRWIAARIGAQKGGE